jgi:hypothetical protein
MAKKQTETTNASGPECEAVVVNPADSQYHATSTTFKGGISDE